jgi:hypothetical protein
LLETNHNIDNYFKNFIKWRLSKYGTILSLSGVPTKTYFRFLPSTVNFACVLGYNPDNMLGNSQMIFAINTRLNESILGRIRDGISPRIGKALC